MKSCSIFTRFPWMRPVKIARAIQDHKDYLQKVLEEHKQSRIQTAEAEVKAETEHVRREVNKALSSGADHP